ncbi:DUF3224 domain-containing protein [Streptomyces sp. NPDC089919]|uniref:DUF3224 domain-containing protein n=1 Tax=Streptomyces sp. NPDC089919 TaxID=3155188 RepID=UPI0034448529
MRASGTFEVHNFLPTETVPEPAVPTAVEVGVSRMEKRYTGEIEGRSATLFTAAYDHASGTGTYLAMESFEGEVAGRAGSFNFAHSASTQGGGRQAEFFVIVPGSGTAALTGIAGGGGLTVEEDGTHRVWFDYDLP